jgi:hypothetical protein
VDPVDDGALVLDALQSGLDAVRLVGHDHLLKSVIYQSFGVSW